MFCADLRDKPEAPFKRLTGVRPAASLGMCEALERRPPSGVCPNAIRRAETLPAQYGAGRNPQQDNPCTTVHLLVKALRENSGPRTHE